MPVAEAAPGDRLFDGGVSCLLEGRWEVRAAAPPEGAQEAAARLLRELSVLEERRAEGDEHAPDPALRRIEAKLDLALELLGRLLPELATLPRQRARLGARGLAFDAPQPAEGRASLVWQPSDALPASLVLPVCAVAPADGRRWAFEALTPELTDQLERHVFRLHRRWLAAQRQA